MQEENSGKKLKEKGLLTEGTSFIENGIQIIDLALYIAKHKLLIVSDFHLGYEDMLTQEGAFIPRFQLKDTLARLESIFKKVKPETVVINGDLKHEFGKISRQEWKDVLQLLDYILGKCKNIKIIKGNHDTILSPITAKRDIEIINKLEIGNVIIVHGDKLVKTSRKVIIIGHEHPAVTIRQNNRVESYKCYLKGKWKGNILIVQPSFNLINEGIGILKEKLLSPYLQQAIDEFEVWVVAKQPLYFGKLKNLSSA